MVRFLLAAFLVTVFTVPSFAENKGEIIFENGQSKVFEDIIEFEYAHEKTLYRDISGVSVFYEGADTYVPFNKIKKFRILKYEVGGHRSSSLDGTKPCLMNGTYLLTTKNGTQLETKVSDKINRLVGVQAKTLNTLTGEISNNYYYFLNQNTGKLNIREILIY